MKVFQEGKGGGRFRLKCARALSDSFAEIQLFWGLVVFLW
jgi:hypothetical protein